MDSPPKHVIVKDQNRMYTLCSDFRGGLFLTAMAGGIGMYEVTIKLDSAETHRFHSEGRPYLDDLVYNLSRECLTTYRSRIITGGDQNAP